MISLLNEFDKQCEHYVRQFVQLSVQQLHGVNAYGHQSSGRQRTICTTSGRQTNQATHFVNWATEVETTGPQLWNCERLTIAVLESNYVQS